MKSLLFAVIIITQTTYLEPDVKIRDTVVVQGSGTSDQPLVFGGRGIKVPKAPTLAEMD